MSGPLRPFEPMRYADLPELPRIPHPFFELPEERVLVRSKHFGDVHLGVRRRGTGPPLLCVHGLMTSSYSFRYVVDRFADRYEVIVFDLPGAGRSDAPDVSYGPRELADLIGDLIETLGIRGTRILGNSMGGYLAMWLAVSRPGVMSRLVNLHSPGAPTPRMDALELAFRFLPGSRSILDALVRRDPERWVFRNVHYFDESLKSREEAREYGAPLRTPEGRRAFHRYLSETLTASGMRDFERTLLTARPFPVPLLLVYVRRDPMVPPDVGARLAQLIPDARLIWLEQGSHFAHVDAPDDFVAAVSPFLAG
jgi:pimeloyl-ACP methyl ester carboxylesterase